DARPRLKALCEAGHPVIEITLADRDALAGEFFRWEFAVTIAASLMGINPFDQPDVESAKQATRRITEDLRSGISPRAEERAAGCEGDLPLYGDAAVPVGMGAALAAHFRRAIPGYYIAILAFLPMETSIVAAAEDLRSAIGRRWLRPTSLGFGPRYL